MIKRGIFVLVLTTLIVFAACKKDKNDTLIPNVPVNVTIYLSLPQYSSLNSIGNNAIIQSAGYRGIIVYRRSIDEFVSYDLACPYDPTDEAAILEVDSSGVAVVDYHCGSRFSLYDGTIINGPATRPMRSYQTDFDGNAVFISN